MTRWRAFVNRVWWGEHSTERPGLTIESAERKYRALSPAARYLYQQLKLYQYCGGRASVIQTPGLGWAERRAALGELLGSGVDLSLGAGPVPGRHCARLSRGSR